jgi:hypothetical protein
VSFSGSSNILSLFLLLGNGGAWAKKVIDLIHVWLLLVVNPRQNGPTNSLWRQDTFPSESRVVYQKSFFWYKTIEANDRLSLSSSSAKWGLSPPECTWSVIVFENVITTFFPRRLSESRTVKPPSFKEPFSSFSWI